jgi:hypothetical protein
MDAMNFAVVIAAILVSNFTVIFIIFHALKLEKETKLAMIEKGMDPEKKAPKNPASTLKLAILCVGFAIGIIVGYLLNQATSMDVFADYLSMILLWGGLALFLSYSLESRKKGAGIPA